MNTVEFVDGNAPGISAALLNEPFHLKGASYDEGVITVTIGPGRANFGGGLSGIVEKLSDSSLTISTPAVNTTYYIFIESDGTFSYDTSSLPKMGVLIGSVATGDPVTILTRDDLRGILPGPITIRTGGLKVFTSSGTFTVPEGVTTIYVSMCGGGGGGNNNLTSTWAGGGGAAAVYKKQFTVIPGESIPITVGIGGSTGSTGGTSSFGSYFSCAGGGGGAPAGSYGLGAPGGAGGERGTQGIGGASLFGIGASSSSYIAGGYGAGGVSTLSPYCKGTDGMVTIEW